MREGGAVQTDDVRAAGGGRWLLDAVTVRFDDKVSPSSSSEMEDESCV